MKKIKSYKNFNESVDYNFDLFALGTLSFILTTIAVASGTILGLNIRSSIKNDKINQKSKEIIENEIISSIKSERKIKSILKKISENEEVKYLINNYKEKISSEKISHAEIISLSGELNKLLSNILTPVEFEFCESIVDRLVKPQDYQPKEFDYDKEGNLRFSDKDSILLRRNWFEYIGSNVKDPNRAPGYWQRGEMKVYKRVFISYGKNKMVYYYTLPEENTKSFFRSKNVKKSTLYTDLDDMLKQALGDRIKF